MEKGARIFGLTGRKSSKGYTLLEYCAGAAIIAGVVWMGMATLGGNLRGFLEGLGGWVTERSTQFNHTNPGGGAGGGG